MTEVIQEYDSTQDTLDHIDRVQTLLAESIHDLIDRAFEHDRTKLGEIEKPFFDIETPKLKKLTYNSPEYKESLGNLQVALDHHYAMYRHHPQFFENGIQEMNLIDVLEMLIDWKAATERHENGDIYKSIEQNAERFGYGEEFKQLLINTANYLGWERTQ